VVTGEDHDGSYRLLFSHQRMIGDLLRGFVHEDWIAELDFHSLEKCGEVQISDRLERREDDLIWRISWQGGEAPVYLLVEFQSTVDPFMAVRNMTYAGLRYEELIRQKELSPAGLLPIVVPLVFYNGKRGWSGAREISQLIESLPAGPRRYVPQLRYLLVDAQREPLPEAEPDNLVGLLFALERSRSHEEIDHGVARLAEVLRGPDSLELRRAFTSFLRYSLLPARFPGARIPAIQDLEEVRPMLRETVQEWTQQWLEEGRQKGLQMGLQEGLQQGEARLLKRQLEQKFGPLTAADQARIQQADAEELLAWGERLLTARTLPEVFGDP
jgi:predicted transposase YdaD